MRITHPFIAFLLALLVTVGSGLPAQGQAPVPPSVADARAITTQIPIVSVTRLPPEVKTTIRLIQQGGPFPYAKDGTIFNNRERLLPPAARGYYREYTVPTPGSRDRGARRIVASKRYDYYYTANHYRSFVKVKL